MMTSKILLGVGTLVPLMATVSLAAPSSIGPTGLLNVPTAETVPTGKTEVTLAYDRLDVAGTGIEVLPIVNLEHGFSNGEVGVSYFRIKGYTAVKAANAKYVFVRGNAKMPSIAVGGMYLRGDTAETDLYLVASHRFGLSNKIRATGGLLYQKPHNASGSNFTGMLGLEVGKPSKTTLGIDYIFDDIAAGSLYGATVRHRLTSDLSWQLGIGNHSRFFTGLTMQFGGK